MRKKIIQYAIMLVIVITSLLFFDFIKHKEIFVDGILGVAVIYYIYRLYYSPVKKLGRFLEFRFPGLVVDIIYGFFMGTALYLALDQLVKVLFWLIKLF
jgi:hypothetical protein